MKKQSSVEWLVQELNHNIEFIPLVNHWDKIRNIIQQAKAMHKEEITDAHYDGSIITLLNPDGDMLKLSEQYYNETFKK